MADRAIELGCRIPAARQPRSGDEVGAHRRVATATAAVLEASGAASTPSNLADVRRRPASHRISMGALTHSVPSPPTSRSKIDLVEKADGVVTVRPHTEGTRAVLDATPDPRRDTRDLRRGPLGDRSASRAPRSGSTSTRLREARLPRSKASAASGYRLARRPRIGSYAEEIETAPRHAVDGRVARSKPIWRRSDSTNRRGVRAGPQTGAAAGTVVIAEAPDAPAAGASGRALLFAPGAPEPLRRRSCSAPTGSIDGDPDADPRGRSQPSRGASVRHSPTLAPGTASPSSRSSGPTTCSFGGRKTSGHPRWSRAAEGTRIAFAVLGIGVNLNVDRDDLPRRVSRPGDEPEPRKPIKPDRPTSTSPAGSSQHLEDPARTARAPAGFDGIREALRSLLPDGRAARSACSRSARRASRRRRVVGIAPDGALELETSRTQPAPRRGRDG